MAYVVRPAPPGLLLDTFAPLSRSAIAAARAWMGPRPAFARYFDNLTPGELEDLTDDGVTGVALLTTSRGPGWVPSDATGHADAKRALDGCARLVVPPGMLLWDDLEEPELAAGPDALIAHVDACSGDVSAARMMAGAYVGAGCGLTGREWFDRPNLRRYWSGCSELLDRFGAPVVPYPRGWSMIQGRPPNFRIDPSASVPLFDVNLITQDDMNGSVMLLYKA